MTVATDGPRHAMSVPASELSYWKDLLTRRTTTLRQRAERAEAEVDRVRDYACRMDALAENRLIEWNRALVRLAEADSEIDLLRLGLDQIVDGNYPATALDAETWAAEILCNPRVVRWESEQP